MKQINNKGLYDNIEMLLRRKWMLIIPLILGTSIGAFVAYNSPSYYKSLTLIMLEQQKVPESYVRPTNETPIEQRLSTISQQIMSRTKLEQIIDQFNLYQGNQNSLSHRVKALLGLSSSKKKNKDDLVIKEEQVARMRKDIEVKVMGNDYGRSADAFSISYIGRDPYVTMQVTNALASFFIEENLKVREQYAEGTTEFLSDELEKAKNELEKQEKALKSYKQRFMGKLPQQMEANLRTLDRLQTELTATQLAIKNAGDRRASLEAQLAALQGALPSPQRALPNPLDGELLKLKEQLASLLSIYKENYPDVMITRSKIKEVEKQLAGNAGMEEVKPQEPNMVHVTHRAEIEANLAAAKSEVSNLLKQEENIREEIMEYQKRVEDTPASEQVLANIERDYQTSQKNYQALLEKKLSARLAENMEKRQKGERFRIIDSANLPERPFKPKKSNFILGGGVFGLGIGAGLVYLFEFLNPAFRRPEDFIGLIDKPVLAVIPVFSAELKKSEQNKLRLGNGAKVEH